MSPVNGGLVSGGGGFPRVSGDEPGLQRLGPCLMRFSPRERG